MAKSQLHAASSWWQVCWDVLKQVYRFASRHPLRAITALLYYQSVFAQAKPSSDIPLVKYNQCPLDFPRVSFAFPQCTSYDELFLHYEVIRNVADMRAVRIFLFAESHANNQHIIDRVKFTNKLANPYDVVEFEGTTKRFPCEQLCVRKTNEGVQQYIEVGDVKHCIAEAKLRKDLICEGWDDAKAHSEANTLDIKLAYAQIENLKYEIEQIIKLYEDAAKIYQLGKKHLKLNNAKLAAKYFRQALIWYRKIIQDHQINILPSDRDLLDQLIRDLKNCPTKKDLQFTYFSPIVSQINKVYPAVQSIISQFIKEASLGFKRLNKLAAEKYNEKSIKQRNEKGLIPKFSLFANAKTRGFFYLRAAHIVATDYYLKEVEHEDILESSMEYSARKALEQHPHAILVPKQR